LTWQIKKSFDVIGSADQIPLSGDFFGPAHEELSKAHSPPIENEPGLSRRSPQGEDGWSSGSQSLKSGGNNIGVSLHALPKQRKQYVSAKAGHYSQTSMTFLHLGNLGHESLKN